jgi:hypothetical protein
MFTEILSSLNDTALANTIRSSVWVFPAMETIHVTAIVIVVGSIARLDLRLAGLVSRNRPVTELVHEMLPWTWTSFIIATIFGVLLFVGQPVKYVGVAFFDVKLILILLAGLNMIAFHYWTYASIRQWDRDPIPPAAVRITGSLSLAFWISVVVCGRLIGFV